MLWVYLAGAAVVLNIISLLTALTLKEHRAFSLCPFLSSLPWLTGAPPALSLSSHTAALRQYSLVIPSLASDKTPERIRLNPRPVDIAARNTNIFHKKERKWTQTFYIYCCKSLLFGHSVPPVYVFTEWTLELYFLCVFFCLILDCPPCLVANLLLNPACGYLHVCHSVYHLTAMRCQ